MKQFFLIINTFVSRIRVTNFPTFNHLFEPSTSITDSGVSDWKKNSENLLSWMESNFPFSSRLKRRFENDFEFNSRDESCLLLFSRNILSFLYIREILSSSQFLSLSTLVFHHRRRDPTR